MADGVLSPAHPAPKPAPADAAHGPRPKRFTQAEFQAIIAAGIIEEGARVELIGGEIYDMAGEGYLHGDGAALLVEALRAAIGAEFSVLMNTRLDLGADSEVYPDILVCLNGTPVKARNPSTVALLVEVADTSLVRDRDVKGPRYAAAGFKEFWIHEPRERRIWVHREPMADGRWGLVFKREGADTLTPLCAPDRAVMIPLLPPEAAGEAP